MSKLGVQLLRRLAERYAITGEYADWVHIGQALQLDGHEGVDDALDDGEFRIHLDALCQAARLSPEAGS